MSSPKRKSLEITSSLISYRKLSIALRKTHQKGLYIGADLELKVTRASFTIKMEQHYDLLFYPERLKVKGGGFEVIVIDNYGLVRIGRRPILRILRCATKHSEKIENRRNRFSNLRCATKYFGF